MARWGKFCALLWLIVYVYKAYGAVAHYSLLFYHLSLRMLEALGFHGVLIQAGEQLERVEDFLVAVFLVQRLLPLIDLTHILQKRHTLVELRLLTIM